MRARAGTAFARAFAAVLALLAVLCALASCGEAPARKQVFGGIKDPRPFHEADTKLISDLSASIIESDDPMELSSLYLRVEALLRDNLDGFDSLEDSIDLEIKLERVTALSCALALLTDDDRDALKILNDAEGRLLALDRATFDDRGGMEQVRLVEDTRRRLLGRAGAPSTTPPPVSVRP